MKKFTVTSVFLLLLLVFSNITYGATPVANAVTTDIVASINGAPIPCCNLYGQVCIFAEDLEDYGFDVTYDDHKHTLDILYNETDSNLITANYVPPQNRSIGALAYQVYPSNVVTKVDGNKMSSYHADGKTLIYLNALKPYGDVVWDPEKRTAAFTSVTQWEYTIPDSGVVDTSARISDFALTLTQNHTGNLEFMGKNTEYLTSPRLTGGRTPYVALEFSLYMDVEQQTEGLHALLQKMLNADLDKWLTNDTAFANTHMKVVINGEQVPVTWVSRSIGNGHVDYRFIIGKQVKTMEDLRSITITCK